MTNTVIQYENTRITLFIKDTENVVPADQCTKTSRFFFLLFLRKTEGKGLIL